MAHLSIHTKMSISEPGSVAREKGKNERSLLFSRLDRRLLVFERLEIALFATGDKTFGDRFQFLPASPDLIGLFWGYLVVGRGGGDHREQIGKFLDDLVGCGDQEGGMGLIGLWVEDEESACALADPLDEPVIFGAAQQGLDAIQRVSAAASAGGGVRGFGPFVNHGQRKSQFGGDPLGAALLKDLPQKLV